MEGSYADAANNYGFKRARWRGLAKMQIQNLIIAAIQNLGKLLRYGRFDSKFKAAASIKTLFRSIYLLQYRLSFAFTLNMSKC